MNKYFGNIIVFDVEGKTFQATIDGKTKHSYTFEQIRDGKPFRDYPEYNWMIEKAHLNAKPSSEMDRGAQPFYEMQIDILRGTATLAGVKIYLLPGGIAKRVMEKFGFAPEDACLAWWHYCNERPEIRDMVMELRPITDAQRRRWEKFKETRIDTTNRIERLAHNGYPIGEANSETDIARRILFKAYEDGVISEECCVEFDIKVMRSGVRKGVLNFSAPRVMPFFVTCCHPDGIFRRNKHDKIGLRTVMDTLASHHFKPGKGSKSAARAKIKHYRLAPAEKKYWKERGIVSTPDKKFLDPVPEIRRHQERMNCELVRIFRKYAP